jgi:hypothetical protein
MELYGDPGDGRRARIYLEERLARAVDLLWRDEPIHDRLIAAYDSALSELGPDYFEDQEGRADFRHIVRELTGGEYFATIQVRDDVRKRVKGISEAAAQELADEILRLAARYDQA